MINNDGNASLSLPLLQQLDHFFVCETAERISAVTSHLKQLIFFTDNEQVKTTINQLCDLLSPAAPGTFLPAYSTYRWTIYIANLENTRKNRKSVRKSLENF